MSNRGWEGSEFAGWAVHERLGSGGNGDVHRATRAGQAGAIKFLKRDLWRGKRYERFKTEVEGMRRCAGIAGVIPLLDANAPDNPTAADPPWIVMELAEPLGSALGDSPPLVDVVRACADIAEALAAMHAIGVSHRDVKPDNLFRFQGRYGVGDLGLVEYDDKPQLTSDGEKLGPTFYIAPEMLNNSATADGKPADVYSFAKTLWVLMTGQRFPLPGQLERTNTASQASAYVSDPRAVLLEPILEKATALDPKERPSMSAIAAELRAWLTPSARSTEAGELDLSDVADEIRTRNAPHHVRVEEIDRRNKVITTETARIRGLFTPVMRDVQEAIAGAHFLNCRGPLQGFWTVRGHILSTAWKGEVELQLNLTLNVLGSGEATVRFNYTAQVSANGATPELELWSAEESFLAGSSQEEQAIQRLITGVRSQLKAAVTRVLQQSKGDEGAPPEWTMPRRRRTRKPQ